MSLLQIGFVVLAGGILAAILLALWLVRHDAPFVWPDNGATEPPASEFGERPGDDEWFSTHVDAFRRLRKHRAKTKTTDRPERTQAP